MQRSCCATRSGFAGVASVCGYSTWPAPQPGAIEPERRHVKHCWQRCGYVKVHITVDSFSALFAPVFKLAGYRAPSQERQWDEGHGSVTVVLYCKISPKYPDLLKVEEDGNRREVGLKDMVGMAASEGYDVVVTAVMKRKLSRCSGNSRFCYTYHQLYFRQITAKRPGGAIKATTALSREPGHSTQPSKPYRGRQDEIPCNSLPLCA
jgi:hypothetical protein